MKPLEVLDIASKIGQIALCSGAEIYRVTFSIQKILEAYDIEGSCYVISTAIFISIKDKKGRLHAQILYITSRTIDLKKLESINELSRKVWEDKPSYECVLKLIKEIQEIKNYSFGVQLLASYVAAFLFTLYFKGNVIEGLFAGAISLIGLFLQVKFFSKRLFMFLEFLFTTMVIAFLCYTVDMFIPQTDFSILLVGSIIVTVPGVPILVAMKDALYGDVLSSMYKFFDTAFIAVAMGIGIISALTIGRLIFV